MRDMPNIHWERETPQKPKLIQLEVASYREGSLARQLDVLVQPASDGEVYLSAKGRTYSREEAEAIANALAEGARQS